MQRREFLAAAAAVGSLAVLPAVAGIAKEHDEFSANRVLSLIGNAVDKDNIIMMLPSLTVISGEEYVHNYREIQRGGYLRIYRKAWHGNLSTVATTDKGKMIVGSVPLNFAEPAFAIALDGPMALQPVPWREMQPGKVLLGHYTDEGLVCDLSFFHFDKWLPHPGNPEGKPSVAYNLADSPWETIFTI